MGPIRRWVLLAIGAVTAGMLLFPPFRYGGQGAFIPAGYAPIWSPPYGGSIDISRLLIQWIATWVVGGLAWLASGRRS